MTKEKECTPAKQDVCILIRFALYVFMPYVSGIQLWFLCNYQWIWWRLSPGRNTFRGTFLAVAGPLYRQTRCGNVMATARVAKDFRSLLPQVQVGNSNSASLALMSDASPGYPCSTQASRCADVRKWVDLDITRYRSTLGEWGHRDISISESNWLLGAAKWPHGVGMSSPCHDRVWPCVTLAWKARSSD